MTLKLCFKNITIQANQYGLYWLGPELFVCCLAHQGSTGDFSMLQIFSDVVWHPGLSIAGKLIVSVSPVIVKALIVLYDLFKLR